jgi:hypothetical protein
MFTSPLTHGRHTLLLLLLRFRSAASQAAMLYHQPQPLALTRQHLSCVPPSQPLLTERFPPVLM